MRQKIVAGNWKMNGQIQQVIELTNQLKELIDSAGTTQVVVMPPAIYIPLVGQLLGNSKIQLGAQNVYSK